MMIPDEYVGYELVTRQKNVRGKQKCLISFYKSGDISISQKAYESIGKPGHVQLLLYRQLQDLHIKVCHENDDSAMQLHQRPRTHSMYISGKNFAARFGLSPALHIFEAEVVENTLIIHLDQEIKS